MKFNLNSWLRKTPQPVAVLVDDKRVDVPKNGRAWRDLSKTIEAIQPSRLTCLDAKGDIIRSTLLEGETADETPSGSNDDSEIVVFARLLTEATKDQPILRHALTFIEQQSAQGARMMADNEKLRAENVKLRLQVGHLQAELNAPEPADDGSVLGQLVAGMAAGQAQQPVQAVRQIKKEAAK